MTLEKKDIFQLAQVLTKEESSKIKNTLIWRSSVAYEIFTRDEAGCETPSEELDFGGQVLVC